MGEDRGVYRVLVVKPEGKRQLWRPRRRWVNNIRMDLKERQVADACECGNEPSGSSEMRGNFLTSCKPVSCSGRTLHHGVLWSNKL